MTSICYRVNSGSTNGDTCRGVRGVRANSSTIDRVRDEHIIMSFNICNCTTAESNRNNNSDDAPRNDGNDVNANFMPAVILLLDDDDDDELLLLSTLTTCRMTTPARSPLYNARPYYHHYPCIRTINMTR
jgi:hypothetical protein